MEHITHTFYLSDTKYEKLWERLQMKKLLCECEQRKVLYRYTALVHSSLAKVQLHNTQVSDTVWTPYTTTSLVGH